MRPALQVFYGGTFDPIHNAHLAIARGARDALGATVALVPAADPPHRPPPGASAEQRARMVALAIAGQPGLRLDRRELERAAVCPQQPSYTVDTLAGLRAESGPQQPLAWLIGGDSLATLSQWHRWQALFELAHVVVVARPGSPVPPDLSAALRACVRGGGWTADAGQLHAWPAGCLYSLPLPLQAGSATAVRRAVAAGQAVDGLVPAPVADFLATHRLYRLHGA